MVPRIPLTGTVKQPVGNVASGINFEEDCHRHLGLQAKVAQEIPEVQMVFVMEFLVELQAKVAQGSQSV